MLSSRLPAGDAAAFNFEDGASVKTMNSRQSELSDGKQSLVDSDDEDDEASEQEDEDDKEEKHNESEGSVDDSEERESVAASYQESTISIEDDEDIFVDVEGLEWPIRQLFSQEEDHDTQVKLLSLIGSEEMPEECVEMAWNYKMCLQMEQDLYEKQTILIEESDVDKDPEYDTKLQWLEIEHEKNQEQLIQAQERLREALEQLAKDKVDDESAQQKHSVGFLPEEGNEVGSQNQNVA